MQQRWTIKTALSWTTDYFIKKGIDAPRLTAELLLCYVLGKDRLYLYLNYDQPLNQKELNAFKELIKRRLAHEPLAYILGEQKFFSFSFKISPHVFIPRPETERLVEVTIGILQKEGFKNPFILDWGTGSGVIAICLAKKWPSSTVFATDISLFALKLARKNAKIHKVNIFLLCTDSLPFKPKVFHIIVSNPPYVKTDVISTLAPEIKYEPREALDGGKDGLKYIRYLIEKGYYYLKEGGFLILEIGYDQAEAINKIISFKNWHKPVFSKDYAGHKRVVAIRKRHG
ncbi:MAG TPA: peptide chain release factor N(5)-glutamine methyltransferase [Candidatus Desulfofervidus auxilii]|uniref:Release factor glutamine methyltransferase n=1 Tax=Desulfofervidus auxilii TaxID=1621989 RepID=A0A7V0I9T0_DESA2|nr:peptide chain release factor N(5)-glutamine methyltransferase [Candidatus Desulfofervidus auxilii]